MELSLAFTLSFLYTLTIFPSIQSIGSQLTLKEHMKITEFLTKDIKRKYPTDGQDEFSDTVTQASAGDFTIYHRGDQTQPVFMTTGKDTPGKPLIVIKRGEDYLIPEDRSIFVVLRQKGGGKEYNVHLAVVYDMGVGLNNLIVQWSDARIEQIENALGVLNSMGNKYLPRRKKMDRRPRCEWVASVLICNAKKTVKGPARKFPPPPKKMIPPPRPDEDGDGGASGGASGSSDGSDSSNGSGNDGSSGGGNDGSSPDGSSPDGGSNADNGAGSDSSPGSGGDAGGDNSAGSSVGSDGGDAGTGDGSSGGDGGGGADGEEEKYIPVKKGTPGKGKATKGKGKVKKSVSSKKK